MRVASMICWPTFIISTTPIIRTKLVVLIMRVTKLMELGIRRRMACGMMIRKYTCFLLMPRASALSYWCFGMDVSAPRTRSPNSPVPQNTKTMMEESSAEIFRPIARLAPKNTMNNSTSCGMMRTTSR